MRQFWAWFTAFAASVSALATSARADVLVVGPIGLEFDSIQAAVSAASPGDLILVRAGDYPGSVTISKPLTLAADVGGQVRVLGTIQVQSIPAGQHVLLWRISALGGQSAPALVVTGCEGVVRLQDCRFTGGSGHYLPSTGTPGGDGARVLGSSGVSFTDCDMRGGDGGGDWITTVTGGDGGQGLHVSGSTVALYTCEMRGGGGGHADEYYAGNRGGDGGDGCRVITGGLFAVDCLMRGGRGGLGNPCGTSGDGLNVRLAAEARLLAVTLTGGDAASSGYCYGPPGEPYSGDGAIHFLPGGRRTLRAPGLAIAGTSVLVSYFGVPGDRAFAFVSELPVQIPAFTYLGMWLIQASEWSGQHASVQIGPSGTGMIPLRVPAHPPGTDYSTLHVQVIARSAAGELRLANAYAIVSPACDIFFPDCNGNGVFDTCDLLSGTSNDINANGYPDECEPDCNGNGIPDDMDIGNGTSQDMNGNGIPDECEATGVTWHVSVSEGGPGGDGSAAAPFYEIADAFDTALPGDQILVAPGVYTGPRNRALDFGGRDVAVIGVGGPDAVVLDLLNANRAFLLRSGETNAALIQGFTIVNGRGNLQPHGGSAICVSQASPTIAECVFRSNVDTTVNGSFAGAVRLHFSSSHVRDCLFEENGATSGSSRGGALKITGGAPTVLRCDFQSNFAGSGGAIDLDILVSGGAPYFGHCRFLGNRATSSHGGAIRVQSGFDHLLWLDHVLFAGNESAAKGSAMNVGYNTRITSSTFVQNAAATDALLWGNHTNFSELKLHNCVVWGNASPGGHGIEMVSQTANVAVSYSAFEGGEGSISLSPEATLIWVGSIDEDPLFADPAGPDGDPQTLLDNDWRLGPGSPCVDAGRNGALAPDFFDLDGDGDVQESVPLDLDGLPRRVDDPEVPDTGLGEAPIVDMGCYERQVP